MQYEEYKNLRHLWWPFWVKNFVKSRCLVYVLNLYRQSIVIFALSCLVSGIHLYYRFYVL